MENEAIREWARSPVTNYVIGYLEQLYAKRWRNASDLKELGHVQGAQYVIDLLKDAENYFINTEKSS